MSWPKVLAIDYGTVRVGLACNQGDLAVPAEILANDDQLFTNLEHFCQAHQIELIILGLSERKMAEETRRFGQQLTANLGLPVTYVDETLSSVTSRERLIEAGAKKKKRGQPIDHLAAALILEDWLENEQLKTKS